ncbi:hypothetical protein Tco_0102859 [Tanacetum coccineum]
MPSTPDLSFTGLDEFTNEPLVENSKALSSKEEPKVVRKNDDVPSSKEWVSNSEEENVSQTKTKKKTVKPSIAKIEFVKPKQQEKTARKTVKQYSSLALEELNLEPSVLTPIPETPLVAPATTLLTHSSVDTIPPIPHQTTAPISAPPITTDAPTITITVPESDKLIKYSLKPAPESSKIHKPTIDLEQESKKSASEINKIRREQDGEVKDAKVDNAIKVMVVYEAKLACPRLMDSAILKSQVPTVVEQYLGSKIGDDLQKVLQRHNADLIKKYSVKPAPESSKIQKPMIDLEQESKKSSSEIHKIKREQAKKQKMPKYTIKSTDKATLKEYDQKSALYQTMHENKSFNRNPANHALYHALMEALIEDKNAMDKKVADTVKNHKRQHDDDDDEDPLAGPNHGKKTKRRRTEELESSNKPSTTKETPKGKASSKGSKTGKSASEKEPVEEPIAEVVMDDAVNTAGEDVVRDDDQPQDTSEPKTYKTPNQDWLKQPLRPPTPDLEWNKRQVVLDQPEEPWFNQMVSATKDPLTFNDQMATPIDFSKYVIELEYNFQECFNALTDKLDWNNLEGDREPFDLSKPLPLQGRPGHLTVAIDYFFNNDLEYLKTSDPEKTYTTSITKTKSARSQMNKFSKHNVYFTQKIHGVKSVSVKKLHKYGNLEEIVVKRADRHLYKFKEGDFVYLHLNDIEDMLILVVQHKLFHLNKSDIVDFIVALRMFTRSLIIKRRVEDLQLGVESYQKKLNITTP